MLNWTRFTAMRTQYKRIESSFPGDGAVKKEFSLILLSKQYTTISLLSESI